MQDSGCIINATNMVSKRCVNNAYSLRIRGIRIAVTLWLAFRCRRQGKKAFIVEVDSRLSLV